MARARNTRRHVDVYQLVTDRIVSLLEQGVIPWRKPWTGTDGVPTSYSTGKPYRGVNTMLLGCLDYNSSYWITYNKAIDVGGHVRRGEKGTLVVLWKWVLKDKNGKTVTDPKKAVKKIPFLKYHNVFNLDQCEGISVPEEHVEDMDNEPIDIAESIVAGMPKLPEIVHGENRAYYHPFFDKVNMPKIERFLSSEEYYSTLFHELVHSTAHETRLNRVADFSQQAFGNDAYAKEELVAEMGASMLAGIAGIDRETIDNSASYIASWIRKLKGDSKLAVQAGSAAQKAADFILNVTWDK